jgi:hypothetical protein
MTCEGRNQPLEYSSYPDTITRPRRTRLYRTVGLLGRVLPIFNCYASISNICSFFPLHSRCWLLSDNPVICSSTRTHIYSHPQHHNTTLLTTEPQRTRDERSCSVRLHSSLQVSSPLYNCFIPTENQAHLLQPPLLSLACSTATFLDVLSDVVLHCKLHLRPVHAPLLS